jgi:NADH-quinone oxidoreductase subunit N
MSEIYRLADGDLAALTPELLLVGGGVLLLLFDAFLPRARRWLTPLAVVAVGGALAAVAASAGGADTAHFGGLIETSALSLAASAVVLLAALLAIFASDGYLRRERLAGGEYHALLLWCAAGLLLMLRARELLTIFLALELLSICLYSLAGYHRRLAIATEAALKYFLMGAFVSAFVLYGIALVWGETGHTDLDGITTALAAGAGHPWLVTLGMLLLVAGFAFKMSLIPFHAWAPDAYQGAPTPFVAFLSVAPKAASAIVLIRLLTALAGGTQSEKWSSLVALLAVLSMVGGNLMALVQRDIKRMLAYSGIAHMGYLLIPLAGIDQAAGEPVLVYLLAYALMNAGAFAIVGMLYSAPGEQHLIADLAGWGLRRPLLAGCLTLCMLSLGGIPPTLGFLGKYLVFVHAIRHGHLWLAVVGVLAALVGVFYYLRVVYTLYMLPEVRTPAEPTADGWGRLAAVIAAGGSLLLGIWPGALLEWLQQTTRVLRS